MPAQPSPVPRISPMPMHRMTPTQLRTGPTLSLPRLPEPATEMPKQRPLRFPLKTTAYLVLPLLRPHQVVVSERGVKPIHPTGGRFWGMLTQGVLGESNDSGNSSFVHLSQQWLVVYKSSSRSNCWQIVDLAAIGGERSTRIEAEESNTAVMFLYIFSCQYNSFYIYFAGCVR